MLYHIERGHCNLGAGFGVNSLLAEGRFSGKDGAWKEGLREKSDLQKIWAVNATWPFACCLLILDCTLELQLFFGAQLMPAKCRVVSLLPDREGRWRCRSLAASQLFLCLFLKQKGKSCWERRWSFGNGCLEL